MFTEGAGNHSLKDFSCQKIFTIPPWCGESMQAVKLRLRMAPLSVDVLQNIPPADEG